MPLPALALYASERSLPRRGHASTETEDAWALSVERGRFAVADGATESFQSGLWARLLVNDFVRLSERQLDWVEWLTPLQAAWADQASRANGLEVGEHGGANGLPWYLEARVAQQGAFAAFLGLVVEEGGWHALAVGDSCLFQVRGNRLVLAFPLTRSADFNSNPWLIGSRTSPASVPVHHGVRLEGDSQPGDRLFLMTDALAQWFLAEHEAGGQPWQSLDEVLAGPRQEFTGWVEHARRTGRLRNDDVTVVAVCL
jgi:hypothetical protein